MLQHVYEAAAPHSSGWANILNHMPNSSGWASPNGIAKHIQNILKYKIMQKFSDSERPSTNTKLTSFGPKRLSEGHKEMALHRSSTSRVPINHFDFIVGLPLSHFRLDGMIA